MLILKQEHQVGLFCLMVDGKGKHLSIWKNHLGDYSTWFSRSNMSKRVDLEQIVLCLLRDFKYLIALSIWSGNTCWFPPGKPNTSPVDMPTIPRYVAAIGFWSKN